MKFVSSNGSAYPFEFLIDGQQRAYPTGGWMSVDDAENYVVCALRGCGLIQLPRFHVEDALRDGRLVEVLGAWESPPLPISAMYPYRRQLSPRVRVFVDWLCALYTQWFGVLPADDGIPRPARKQRSAAS